MACKVLIRLAATAAVLFTAARPAHAQNQPAPADPPATSPAVATTPAALLEIIAGTDTAQPQRDEAARRLLVMNTPEAESALQKALINPGNPRGQQAAARALAEDPTPDPIYVTPLAALIGADPASTEAAARALANLRTSEDARLRLLSAAASRELPMPSRTAVIRSLAPLADKRAAQLLVEIVTNNGEGLTARQAAADELTEMTGLTGPGRDAGRWRQWWAANEGKPDAQFETEVLAARAARLDRIEPRHERLVAAVQLHLRDSFRNAPPANREQVLIDYLRSDTSEVRQVGAGIVIDLFDSASDIPAAAQQQLRTLIGDSDEQVRLQAAAAVQRMNDVKAIDAVLGQLAVERSPAVRAALAAALAPMGQPQAVPPLLRLLKDDTPAVVEAAAAALQSLRDQLPDPPANLVTDVSRSLNEALARVPTGADGNRLREQLVTALVAWANPEEQVRRTFVGLIGVNQPPAMRRLALRYFGQMGSDLPWPADNIINSGALESPDESVRVAAVQALARTARAEHAARLYERLYAPADVEPSQRVRDEAWKALAVLFPREFNADQLNNWADKFRDAPDRRLTVLETLRDKLIQERKEGQLALVRQNIGETYAALGQHGRAAQEFRQAMESPGRTQDQAKDYLITQLIRAYLLDGNFKEATQFGARMIGENRRYQSTIGPAITSEARRLAGVNQADQALRLVGLALKMDPPLEGNFAGQLRGIEQQLRAKVDVPATTPAADAAQQ